MSEEDGDTSSSSILSQFQTVIQSDQTWILKWGHWHYNLHVLFYLCSKFENDRGMSGVLFRGLEMRHSVVGYIAQADSVAQVGKEGQRLRANDLLYCQEEAYFCFCIHLNKTHSRCTHSRFGYVGTVCFIQHKIHGAISLKLPFLYYFSNQ